MSVTDQRSLESLLEFLQRNRGFDFTGYRRATIERRVTQRMQEVGAGTHAEYIEHLELHPREYERLFDALLINVTSFFRDPATWDCVRGEIVPRLLERRPEGAPLRAWSAGCASGEEAYTLAMVLADALGRDAFLERVKIYATDVDEDALATARQGVYGTDQLAALPADLRERFFEPADGRLAFRRDLRRAIIFGRNDLVQDAPISRIDLLVCRNTLMYFNVETQAHILNRLHFALRDDGAIVLGRAEMLITHSDLFVPVALRGRVFNKVSRPAVRERPMLAIAPPSDVPDGDAERGSLVEGAFDAARHASIVLDADGTVVAVNALARQRFGVSRQDVGRPLQDLELSYRPLELREPLERARAESQSVTVRGVAWQSAAGQRMLDVHVTPFLSADGRLGSCVAYDDVTDAQRLSEELERSLHHLGTAYDELQSTVEELETTNEELQTTNEELETTNEGLQSANEELEAMNDELRVRTAEIREANGFLEAVLGSLELAAVAVDEERRVRLWNSGAEDLWGLRSDEAEGEPLLELQIGLPVGRLETPVRRVLDGREPRAELDVDATTRLGRALRCHLTVLPLQADGRGPTGAMVLMATADG